MAKYIGLVNFTEQGLRNVADSVTRAEKAKEAMAAVGAKMVDICWTMGPYDIVVTVEAPDDETATRATLAIAKAGNIRGMTLRAFDAAQMSKIVKGL
jgi:uncharacterized protein with GYD domain